MSITLEVTKSEWYEAEVEVEGLDEVLTKVYEETPLTDAEVLLLFDTKDNFYELAEDADASGEYDLEVSCPELDSTEFRVHKDRYDDLCNKRNEIRRQEWEKERIEKIERWKRNRESISE